LPRELDHPFDALKPAERHENILRGERDLPIVVRFLLDLYQCAQLPVDCRKHWREVSGDQGGIERRIVEPVAVEPLEEGDQIRNRRDHAKSPRAAERVTLPTTPTAWGGRLWS